MNDEDDHASQVALARTNLYSIQPRLSIDAVRSVMGLWLMRHFDDIEDAFDFFYLGNTSGENWTEKLSNCVCALFFVCVFVLISSFLGFCLLWALAPILLILVGTPRTCGFGQRRICLSSLCSNTYYWEWTRPGDQDRSYLEIWTYFHNSTGRFFWLRFSCMFNVISNCKDSMKKKPFSFLWFHSLYLAKKRCLWPYLIFVNFGTPLHCKRHAKKSA